MDGGLKGGGVSLVMQLLQAHLLADEAEESPQQSITDIRIVPWPQGQDVLTEMGFFAYRPGMV